MRIVSYEMWGANKIYSFSFNVSFLRIKKPDEYRESEENVRLGLDEFNLNSADTTVIH